MSSQRGFHPPPRLFFLAPLLVLTLAWSTGGAALQAQPQELVFSTYLGASGVDLGDDIAVDAAGNTWVVGSTSSVEYPTTPDALDRTLGQLDAFLTRWSPAGELLYSTFLGGSGNELGLGVALDAAGNVYVTGSTDSPDFPRVGGLPATLRGAGGDVFVAKLSPSGSALVYSAVFGGSGDEYSWGFAVDAAGAAYVAGETTSRDFPVVGGLQGAFGGGFNDAFVAKLSPGGSSLSYSTYLGGSGAEAARGLAVDPAGRAAVGGYTHSPDFPTANALSSSVQGSFDAFVSLLETSGSAFAFSTYLGGRDGDEASGLAFDDAGRLYVVGRTASLHFPVIDPLQGFGGGEDAFVTQWERSGALLFSTFLGGDQADSAQDVAVGRSGRISLAGTTYSTNFPLVKPLQATCLPPAPSFSSSCSGDGFVAELAPGGSALLFSTFLGGRLGDEDQIFQALDVATGIAVDHRGNLHVTGETYSHDFPTFNGFLLNFGGEVDGFLVKISLDNQPPDCSGATASPALLWPPNGKLVPVSIRGITDREGALQTVTWTGILQDEALSQPGVPDAFRLDMGSALLRASRASRGDGRVYHLFFTATDADGASCAGTVAVCVPHDQGRRGTCGDGGAIVTSTGTE